jgi:hypothetical protein
MFAPNPWDLMLLRPVEIPIVRELYKEFFEQSEEFKENCKTLLKAYKLDELY